MYIYNVKPIGEIELLKHLRTLEEENILLIDARSREWHKRGTIPTATNLPFTMLKEGNDNLPKVLKLLGAKRDGDKWDLYRCSKNVNIWKWDMGSSSNKGD